MQAMRRSTMTVCINNFRQMGIGAGVFGTDNNGDMPMPRAAPHPTLGPCALSGYGTEAIWGTYGSATRIQDTRKSSATNLALRH